MSQISHTTTVTNGVNKSFTHGDGNQSSIVELEQLNISCIVANQLKRKRSHIVKATNPATNFRIAKATN